MRQTHKVMPKVKYDPKENRDEDHKEDNSPEEPPMAPPILANANNRPEVSAPLMLQEQSYQAYYRTISTIITCRIIYRSSK